MSVRGFLFPFLSLQKAAKSKSKGFYFRRSSVVLSVIESSGRDVLSVNAGGEKTFCGRDRNDHRPATGPSEVSLIYIIERRTFSSEGRRQQTITISFISQKSSESIEIDFILQRIYTHRIYTHRIYTHRFNSTTNLQRIYCPNYVLLL